MGPRSISTFAAGRLCARLLCALRRGEVRRVACAAVAAWLAASVAVAVAEAPPHGEVAAKPAPAEQSTAEYFPMSLGDRWVYKKTSTHPGEEPAVSETYSLVRGEYLFNGELWAHYEEDGICFWVHNRDDGQYEADVGYDDETAGLQIEREFLLFRMPVKKGDSWPFLADFLSDDQPGTVRCVAVDETVTTPAGKFTCVVYELDEKDTKATYHIARGAGMVASEWTFKETGESIKLELKRFLPGEVRRARIRPQGASSE